MRPTLRMPQNRSPNTIVGSHLVEPIHSSHVAVVASDADGHKQVHDLSVAMCCSHSVLPGVISGNHANVTLVTPLAKHDASCIGPLGRFSLLQNDPSKCSWEVSPRPTYCATQVPNNRSKVSCWSTCSSNKAPQLR